MVVPQLVHSIKRTFWWRTMTAVQKILLIMITYTRCWMRKADRKLRLISIEIEGQESSSSLIFPLFYSIKDFLTLYEHLSRVGIDHTFTCLLQWKGHILPHLYLAYKEVGISHKLTRSFHCSDAQNQSGRPTICKLRKTEQLQYFWLQIAKPIQVSSRYNTVFEICLGR